MSSLLRTRLCQLHFYSASWMNGRKDGVTLADSSVQPMGFILSKQAANPPPSINYNRTVIHIGTSSSNWPRPSLSHLDSTDATSSDTAESSTWSRDQSFLALLEHVPW